MYIEERLEFIDSLAPLPILPTRSFSDFQAQDVAPPHDPNKPTASVMPGTINAFFSDVSQQTISDVNLCKLVMQNAADKLYPNDNQLFEWYKYYVGGLSKLGWVIQAKNLQEVTIKRTGLTIDQVALEMAAGLIGANPAAILTNLAKKSLEEVQKNPRAIQIFEKNQKLGYQAKFDIAPVWVDNSGMPNMILNCISLDARESSRGILFWKSTKQSTAVKSGAVRTYLDSKVLYRLSDSLYDKFDQASKKSIENLPDLD
ncbi:hypothetical protein PMI35_02944 [Pseudomonas sp. GM78]|uniref:hypothetical protein n=1 Tax=Pseudomonas sp. GM78 TaxID=1144337 RepID=UPI0002708A39|nr:hypothetical protein [Pseudomonas sp. GM78]EJN28730.1 hypothetical protein PMI35_02944 [Pseudomonas sp. GM78]